jgi:hypothetical protein
VAHIYLTAYGVKLDVEVEDDGLLPKVEHLLPPGWERSNEFPEDGHLTLLGSANGSYDVLIDGEPVAARLAADVALHVFDSQLRLRVAALAEDRIFVHAGVVSVAGRALLLPGRSFSGKTTLVAALISEGALYYSDEFAVLDAAGLAHPYPRRLALRTDGDFRAYADASALGGRTGSAPVKPALIAITRWSPGRRWNPEPRGPGIGALALLSNTVAARPRTAAAMRSISLAVDGATVLEGDRGEATETAKLMLATLEAMDRSVPREASGHDHSLGFSP